MFIRVDDKVLFRFLQYLSTVLSLHFITAVISLPSILPMVMHWHRLDCCRESQCYSYIIVLNTEFNNIVVVHAKKDLWSFLIV